MENLALTHPDLFEAARQAFARTLETVVFSENNYVLPIRRVRGDLFHAMWGVDDMQNLDPIQRRRDYLGVAEAVARDFGYRRASAVVSQTIEDGEPKLVFHALRHVRTNDGPEYWVKTRV